MTAPAVDTLPDGPIPDGLLAEALTQRAESGRHFATGEPAAEPVADEPPVDPKEPAPPADAPADQPPVDATGAVVDPAADPNATPADPASGVDPFAALVKEAKPLTYRMNGADYAHPMVFEVPGKGAVVPADQLGEFRNFIARAESNAATAKALLADREQYERIGGLEKVHETQERFAAINEVGLLLLDAIRNPLSLVTIDAQGQVIPHAERIQILQERMKVASERAIYDARQERVKQEQTYRTTTQDTELRAAAIPNAINGPHFAKYDPADRASALAFFARRPDAYLFTVTPETAATYGQPVGTLMVDAESIAAYLDEKAADRAKATTDASKREAAARENVARTTVRPVAPKPKAAPAQPRDEESGQWKPRKRIDPSDIYDRALAGKPVSGAASYDDLT